MTDETVVHRLRLSQANAHYGGDLIAGGRVMELFGDAATELCIRTDDDEGLLAGYSIVQFLAELHAGDFVEVRATLTNRGNMNREMNFDAYKLRGVPARRVRFSGRSPVLPGARAAGHGHLRRQERPPAP